MQNDASVPYSKVGLELLAQAMNITTAAIYVSPVTNSLQLRDSFIGDGPMISGISGDHGSAGVVPSRGLPLSDE